MFCGGVQICEGGSKSASEYGPGGVQIRSDTSHIWSFVRPLTVSSHQESRRPVNTFLTTTTIRVLWETAEKKWRYSFTLIVK